METTQSNPEQPELQPSSAAAFRDRSRKINEGEVIKLDSGLVVRARRPSVTLMVQAGQIPASLAASALKYDSGREISDRDVKRLYELKVVVTKAALITPKIVDKPADQLADDEILITDLVETDIDNVYMFVQVGLEVLNKFRAQRQGLLTGPDSETLPGDEA